MPETPPDSYAFTNLPQALTSPVTDSYRIQKASQKRGSIVSPQAVARGIEADQRTKGSLLPRVSPKQEFIQPMQTNGSLHGHNEKAYIQESNQDRAISSIGPQGEAYANGRDLERERSRTSIGRSQRFSNGVHGQDYHVSHAGSSVSSPRSQAWPPALVDEPKPQASSIAPTSCCHGKTSTATPQFLEEQTNGKNGTGNANNFVSQHHSYETYGGTQQMPLDASLGAKASLGHSPVPGNWYFCPEQTTLYTLPPTYATASHPLNPTRLAYLQQSPNGFAQTIPYQAPYGLTGSAAPSADGSNIFNSIHNCNCGDGCNCLGCAAHPYNATTRHHVQDLGRILEDGHVGHDFSRPQSSYGSPVDMINIHNMLSGDASANHEHITSPTTTRSPQELAATPMNQNADGFATSAALGSPLPPYPVYSSSSYYTMEFPLDQEGLHLGCTDISGGCQCGSDCACIGCLTHTGHEGDSSYLDPTAIQQVLEQPSNLGSVQNLEADASPALAQTL
ncbi:MAG: hypothetical protein Q9187_007495 [Circinaria calcarea]